MQKCTGGSKNQNGVGSAIHIPSLKCEVKYKIITISQVIRQNCSHYMKLIKLIEAYKFIICTNTQSAILDLQSTMNTGEGSDLVYTILYEVYNNFKEIVFQWVPGTSLY